MYSITEEKTSYEILLKKNNMQKFENGTLKGHFLIYKIKIRVRLSFFFLY